MLFQVVSLLLDVAVTLIGGACLLRLYMRWQGMPAHNPVGQFVLALTGWLVRPLQKLLPPAGRLDMASFAAAWLLKLLQFMALFAMLGLARWGMLPVLALLGVARLVVSVATAVIIVTAILSWVGSHSPVREMFQRLSAPLLAPLRRVLPLVGGVDLSPLLAVLALQVLAIVLGALQSQLFGTTLPLGLLG